MLSRVSKTFHGRDIFAPTAAHLASWSNPADFGPEIHDYVIPKFAMPELTGNELQGEVLHIDDFGNLITNISAEVFKKTPIKEGSTFHFRFKDKGVIALRFCSAYGEAQIGKPLALIGSHDFLEISINQGNASKKFRTKTGDPITVVLDKQR
jgi:S-adenosylmethionine hydrolase